MTAVKELKYMFAGNRFFVLEEMLQQKLNVCNICAVKGSYLERELQSRGISFTTVANKKDIVAAIEQTDFDMFVANGLPYILPISKLKEGNTKQFVNVHPSYLPDLRGADPVPGAILHGRNSGATCHYMDDGIDTGAIIERELIINNGQLDAALLYQLSFSAERAAFRKAYKKGFVALEQQPDDTGTIYYTISSKDKVIDFSADSDVQIVQRISAFNTPSQGAYFVADGEMIKVQRGTMLQNSFLNDTYSDATSNVVVLKYSNCMVVKRYTGFLVLELRNADDLRMICIGQRLDK